MDISCISDTEGTIVAKKNCLPWLPGIKYIYFHPWK